MLLVSGCHRRMPDAPAQVGQSRLQLQCDQQSTVLRCQAFGFDDTMTDVVGGRDVTDNVQWTSSDDQVAVVKRGRIRAGNGGTAIVTAVWTERPAAASASVLVVARHGDARKAYVLAGEVRAFPTSATSDGVAGARVTLIDDTGVEQTVTTPSAGGTQGQFRFVPVAGGNYQLRAVREGYRSRQVSVTLPDNRVYIVTLLQEPRDHR